MVPLGIGQTLDGLKETRKNLFITTSIGDMTIAIRFKTIQ